MRTKLSLLELLEQYRVVIPRVQRDYAQGRESENIKEIRSQFIKDLFRMISRVDKTVDLDFIYGTIQIKDENLELILLDGQQRLTTLWLIHWYIASRESTLHTVKERLLKFYYDTRLTAREFCRNLLDNGELAISTEKALSTDIKNKTWFYGAYESDPTVKSMLTMLDTIHHEYNGRNEELWDKLVDVSNKPITFQFLPMSDFDLTDELYIKMNARGKALTPFENFKANFEQHLGWLNDDLGDIDGISYREYFGRRIDREWGDLFWKFRNTETNTYDNEITNFFRIITTFAYISEVGHDEIVENLLDTDIAKKSPNYKKNITFNVYRDWKALEANLITRVLKSFDILLNPALLTPLNESYRWIYSPEETFCKILKFDTSYQLLLKFYAFVGFHITEQTGDINQWMRVIYNLVENTEINGADEFVKAVISIEQMLSILRSDDSLTLERYLCRENATIEFFYGKQVTEEMCKAKLLQADRTAWEEPIYKAEKHGYFDGQIGFLLHSTGLLNLTDYEKDDWSKEVTSFRKCYEQYDSIFSEDGLRPFEDSLFERTLLSQGDYCLWKGSKRHLIGQRTPYYNWKRLLREYAPSDFSKKWGIINDVVTQIDVKSVTESLTAVMNNPGAVWSLQQLSKVPDLISFCKGRQVISWDDIQFYILKGSNRVGDYVEFFSYYLYSEIKKIDSDTLLPFTRCEYHIGSNKSGYPYIIIDGYQVNDSHIALNISFNGWKEFPWQITLFSHDKCTREQQDLLMSYVDPINEEFRYVSEENKIVCHLPAENQHFNMNDAIKWEKHNQPYSPHGILSIIKEICTSFSSQGDTQ